MLDSTNPKSAFTPVGMRGSGLKSPVNLFEPSPLLKQFIFSTNRFPMHQDSFLMPSSSFPLKKVFSPENITPSDLLRKDNKELQASQEPACFSFDVIMPTTSALESPLAQKEDQNGTTDEEDSTMSSHPNPNSAVKSNADSEFGKSINLKAVLGRPFLAPAPVAPVLDLNIQVDNILRK